MKKYLLMETAKPDAQTALHYGKNGESRKYYGINGAYGVCLGSSVPSADAVKKYGFDTVNDAKRGGKFDTTPSVFATRFSCGYVYTCSVVEFDI